MSNLFPIASGLGQIADFKAATFVVLLAALVSTVWGIIVFVRREHVRLHLIGIAVLMIVAFCLGKRIMIAGRAYDDRKHREAFPELYGDEPASN
jgi:hypothetical protein